MNKDTTYTLVLEYNYDEPGVSMGSVWLFSGDGTPALQQSEPLATIPSWVKIIGPVDYDLASSVHAALKQFFEQAGVTVIDEGVAD